MSGERVIIELKGADVIGERLEKMRMKDKMVKKQINFLVKKVMQEALKKTKAETREKLLSYPHKTPPVVGGDPRKAHQAVRMMIYKKIIGGNLNIFAPRKAGASKYADFHPKGKMTPGQRGGNRRKRSADTIRMDTYMGKDRGFILRWMQKGTNDRTIEYSSPKTSRGLRKSKKTPKPIPERTGKRGRLKAILDFPSITDKHLQDALEDLLNAVSKTFDEIWLGKL